MAQEQIDQAVNQLKQASNILVVIGNGASIDSIASAAALREFMLRLEKKVKLVTASPISGRSDILSNASTFEPATAVVKNLIIDVSLAKTELSELGYEKKDNRLSIVLTPKSGEFVASDVSIKSAVYPFDLIITLGVATLEKLGALYERQAELFFSRPVINIDFSPANETYGQINLVDLTSSSVCEIIFELLQMVDKNFIDESIATLLLSGIIEQTNNFQNVKTTPKVFNLASNLVSLGARQQELVAKLYKSKSLGLLRLWGRVLARLKDVPDSQLVYSLVNQSDIDNSQAGEADLETIIFEMIQQLSFAKNFLFFVERNGQTQVYAATSTRSDLANLFARYNPEIFGPQIIRFNIVAPQTQIELELLQIFSGRS